MTVRDILTMTNAYTDVIICNLGDDFRLVGSADKLLTSANFILDREVELLGVGHQGIMIDSSTYLRIIISAEEKNSD